MPIPETDIITVTYGNMLPVLKRTVESLYKFREAPFRLIVVNNGSRDGTAAYCAGLPDCELIDLPENVGTVKALNLGLKKSVAPFIARMDHDVEFVMPWQSGLLGLFKTAEDVGMAGPRLLNTDGTLYAALFSFFFKIPRIPARFKVSDPFMFPRALRRFVHYTQHSSEADDDLVFGTRRAVYHVSGAFFVMKRAAFEKVGFPDESYPDMNGSYEDLDYTLRFVKNGFKIIYEGGVKVVHHCSRPENFRPEPALWKNHLMFKEKWGFL
ncbi:MAG: glycosyltransferase family 2 protein [Elusimicrobiales bacterium]|jgi:GT2 family glycosyltransferase